MDQLLNNPVMTMWGPSFLGFYAMLWGIALVWFLFQKRRIDSSRELASLPLPEVVDPYQLAYLRGGLNELLRLGTVELFSRGVMIEEKKWLKVVWKIDEAKVPPGLLTPIAREVGHFYRELRKPADLFRPSAERSFLENSLTKYTDPWDEGIEKEQLRVDPNRRSLFTTQVALVVGALLFLGALKIASAILREHYNLGFLIFMMMCGAIVSLVVCIAPKFSDRGRRFLKEVQLIYGRYSKVDKNYRPGVSESKAGHVDLAYDTPVMAMGLFGVAALQGSAFSSVHLQFQKSASSGSSCGGGCSSGSSCGSGCGGGGCGGCGGCGS